MQIKNKCHIGEFRWGKNFSQNDFLNNNKRVQGRLWIKRRYMLRKEKASPWIKSFDNKLITVA